MNRSFQKKSSFNGVKMTRVGILHGFCVSLLILISNSICLAQQNSQSALSTIDDKSNQNFYSYNTEGRSDPFKPFMSPKSSATSVPDPNEIVDVANNLTGMQLFEPGQLTLVGVILSSREPIALVEDQTKKGYILKPGDFIGKRGVVSFIDNQQMVITETAKTRAGKALKTTTTMRLKKEGDA
jgi:type IV pilus assembly protein PilP